MKVNESRLIISGSNLELTDSLKRIVEEKTRKLFDHETKIDRLRVDLSDGSGAAGENVFAAKGIIEIRGPDMVVSVKCEDLYKSIDGMVHKLDRMIRRRSRLRVVKRKHTHDVEIPASIPKTDQAFA